jgi:hypothetical protein
MPATYSAEHLTSRMRVQSVDFDPDSADPVVATLNPAATEKLRAIASGGRRFMAVLVRSVGTGAVDAFEIIAAGNAAGTTSPTVVVAHAGPTVANAVGDQLVLECDVEQVREVLASATHVGVRVELATNTDECIITFIEAEHAHPRAGLTADYIS